MTMSIQRGRQPARRLDHPFAGLAGFDDLFDRMSRMLTTAFPDVARISISSWSPPVDVQESDDAYVVEADLPGVRPDDVEVDLQGHELHITGEYGTGEGDGGERRGRRSGRFDYRVTLPSEVRTEECSADLDNGVLRLRLPKTASAMRQRIPVQSQAQQSQRISSTSGTSGNGGTR